jgi:hypothetical protein
MENELIFSVAKGFVSCGHEMSEENIPPCLGRQKSPIRITCNPAMLEVGTSIIEF